MEKITIENDPIRVRQAQKEDLETLLRFEQGVIGAERPFDNTLKPEKISYYDLAGMIEDPLYHVVVAEQNGEIIASGYANIRRSKPFLRHSTYAYLGFMFVLDNLRGKGINKLIMDAIKDWSHSKGITEMRLQVYAENESAIKAYEKFGFEKHLIEMRMSIDIV